MLQVLVDADNLTPRRLDALLAALPLDEASVVVAGSRWALGQVRWPARGRVREVVGPEEADRFLADAYRPGREPLVLASGDKGFAALVRGHAGPVLVVSDRPAKALRGAATVLDPVRDGASAVRGWCEEVLDPLG